MDDDTVLWPSSPYELVDTSRCPACFTPVTGTDCTTCGLRLTDARLADVLTLSRRVLDADLARRDAILTVRASQRADAAEAARAAQSLAPVASVAFMASAAPMATADDAGEVAASLAPSVPRPTVPAPTAPAPAVPALTTPASPVRNVASPARPAAPARARRRITVPTLLLIVGVSLVGIAAIFFLTVAWFVASITVRALIIGAITLATIVTASLLRRRGLTSTAEAIAVIGIILIGLDAWAVRANGLFAADALRPAVYGGLAILAVAVLCRAWARISRLRAPDISSVLLVPVGVALLAGGATDLATGHALVVGLAAGSVGALTVTLPAPWSAAHADSVIERTILAALGVVALVAAYLSSVFGGAAADTSFLLWITPAIVVIAAVWWAALRRRTEALAAGWANTLGGAAAATSVAAAGTVGWQLALYGGEPWTLLVLAPVLAVLVAVVVDRFRVAIGIPRVAVWTSAIIALLSLAFAALLWLAQAAGAVSRWAAWQTDAAQPPRLDTAWLPLAGTVLLIVLAAIAPTLRTRVVLPATTGVAAGLLLVAAVASGVPIVATGAGLAVAGASLALAARTAERAGPQDAARVWSGPLVLGALAAYTTGMASAWLWIISALAAVALPPVFARAARVSGPVRVTLTVASVAIATVSALIAPQAIAAIAGLAGGEGRAAFALVQWVALATLALALALRPSVGRSALAWAGLVVGALSLLPAALTALPGGSGITAGGGVSAAVGEPVAAIVRGVLLLSALAVTAWATVRGGFPIGIRSFAAVLLAPAAGAVIIAVCDAGGWPDAAPPLAVGAFAALAVGNAVAGIRRPVGSVRAAGDIGTVVATALVAWQVRSDLAWPVLTLIAVLFAATSVTRGWAAPRTAALSGVPTAAFDGVPTMLAPRRLLNWAASAFAIGAFTTAVARGDLFGAHPAAEAYSVIPAVGLLALAGVLTWLRRHAEATVSTVLGLGVGLVLPAIWSTASVDTTRTIVTAVVGALVVIVVAWTPVRRAEAVSVAAAATSLVAAVVVLGEVIRPGVPAANAAWAALPTAAALIGAIGFARRTTPGQAAPGAASAPAPAPASAHTSTPRLFALLAPPATIVLGAGAVAVMTWFRSEPLVTTGALATLLALSVVAAALGRTPFGAATRWSSVAGAVYVAAVAIPSAPAVEVVSLPFAAALLAGSAVAMVRRARAGLTWPERESIPWLVGIAAAMAPSLLAGAHPGRSWLLVTASLLAAVGVTATAPAPTRRLGASTVAVLLGGTFLAGALGMLRLPEPHDLLVPVVAGAGIAACGAVTLWRRLAHDRLSPAVAAAGSALVAIAIAVRGDGSLAQTLLVAGLGTAGAVAAALVLARPLWLQVAGILSVGAATVALVAVGVRFVHLVAIEQVSGVEPDAWVLAGLGIAVLVAAAAVRTRRDAVVAQAAGLGVAAVIAVAAVAEAVLIWTGSPSVATERVGVAVAVLTVTAVGGRLLQARLSPAPLIAAATGLVVVAGTAVTAGAADPIEVVTVAPAAGLVILGTHRMRTDAAVLSWPAIGPGLLLATVPSLLHDLLPNALWRIVALGVVAVVLVVIGATRRLQASLVIGTIVLLTHGIAQLWPWISSSYSAVPWWLWVGIGGILLIVIAARYERQLTMLRTTYAAVTSLR